jgi:hypothetical protein
MKNIYEVALGCFTVAFISAFMMNANASTYIDYPDGSSYTVPDGQNVYVTNEIVFTKRVYANGAVYFTPLAPNAKRDQEVSSTSGLTPGSHDWCKAFVPWSNGFTFGQMTWDSQCDTNNDGVYNSFDEGWEG